MSKSDTKASGALGYFLSEDGEFRLRKLHQHIEFLSHLAEPRVDEEEDGPEIDHPALAGCLELLAEQVRQVLDAVSGPARLEAKSKPATVEREAEDTDNADEETESEDDASAGTEAKVDKNFAFGMTLDQVDEADRLLDLLRAQGDLLMAGGGGDFADGTIIVIGAAIFDNADEMKDMIRQIGRQTLDAKPGVGSRVREMPATYVQTASAENGATRIH